MKIIYSETKLPFLEQTGAGYFLNSNQRQVTITEQEEEKVVWEIYQEHFKRFPTIREKLDAIKSAVTMYANSKAVKRFAIGTIESWLNSEQRSSIKDAIESTVKAGGEEYTLWLNNNAFTMPCAKALDVISAIEWYSCKCYNVTSQYYNEIENCGADTERACGIDFTLGYPEIVVIEND